MTRSNRPGLVIDASIIEAARGTRNKGLQSTSTDFLESVYDLDYYIVLTPEISREWSKHHTRYSYTWRNRMAGRKRIKVIAKADNPELQEHFQSCVFEKSSHKKALKKDLHLLEAAFASDKRIASRDEKARAPARILATSCAMVRDILWINPAITAEQPLAWLQAGAPMGAHHLLGHQAR